MVVELRKTLGKGGAQCFGLISGQSDPEAIHQDRQLVFLLVGKDHCASSNDVHLDFRRRADGLPPAMVNRHQ
jgi:hypothetical protein